MSMEKHHKLRPWAVRLFRALILVSVLLVVRMNGHGHATGGVSILLDDTVALYPGAFALRPGDDLTTVFDESEGLLGFVVKTLPVSEKVIGYSGPSDVLVAIDDTGTVTGTQLLWSGDTPEHSDAVRKSPTFFAGFVGWQLGADNDVAAVDGVSGATLTSLAIIESVALRLGGHPPSLKFPDGLRLDDVQRIFAEAHKVSAAEAPEDGLLVLDERGTTIGHIFRTSPEADAIAGYQGPSDTLIGLTPDGNVAGISLGATYDNQRYADYVRDDAYFRNRHQGKSLADLAALDKDQVWADGVSGATMTSGAVMEGVILRAQSILGGPKKESETSPWIQPKWRDGATFLAIVLGCFVAFTRFRASRYARTALHLYLVVVLGLWAGDMVSLAVLGGWATGSVPLKMAPGLVALVAAALVLPWLSGKPVYCQHLCPHGAAQLFLYRLIPGRLQVPGRVHRYLTMLPLLILGAGIAIATLQLPVSLSALEAFDAWIFGIGGLATLVIAVVGLGASAFVPQAYCKYGCPTGLVLDYLRARHHDDSLNRRDAVACALLVAAVVMALFIRG